MVAARSRHANRRHAATPRDWAAMNPRDLGAMNPRVCVAVCPLAVGVVAPRGAVGAAAHVRAVAVDSPTATNLRGVAVALGDPPSWLLRPGVAAERGDPPIRMPPRGVVNLLVAVVVRVGTTPHYAAVDRRGAGSLLLAAAAIRRAYGLASPEQVAQEVAAELRVLNRLPGSPNSAASVLDAAAAPLCGAARPACSLECSTASERPLARAALRRLARGPSRPISTGFPDYPWSVFCCAVDAGRGSRFVAASWAAH